MSRLTAKDAHNIAETINSARYLELKDNIDSLIRKACEKGEFSTYYDGDLPVEVISYFRDLGYNVKYTNYRNENSCTISWK